MTSQLVVRLNKDQKERFQQIARMEGKSSSDVLREMVDKYIDERDAMKRFEELWDSIGKQLKENGITEEDIKKEIKAYRKERSESSN